MSPLIHKSIKKYSGEIQDGSKLGGSYTHILPGPTGITPKIQKNQPEETAEQES